MKKSLLKLGFQVCLLTSVLATVIASRYFQNNLLQMDWDTLIYLLFATLGNFFSLALIIYTLFYIPVVFIAKKYAKIIGIFFNGTFLFLIALDTWIFQIYRFHLYNPFLLEMLFSQAAKDIFKVHISQYFLLFGLWLLMIGLQYGCFFLLQRISKLKKYTDFILYGAVLSLVFSHLWHAYSYAVGHRQITKISLALPFYFPLRADEIAGTEEERLEKAKLTQLKYQNQEEVLLNYPKNPLIIEKNSQKNILIILIDSWNYRTFDPEIMPNIYQFGKKSKVFKEHYSGSNGTRTGVFSLFYGIPGTYFDAVFSIQKRPGLMETFAKYQYEFGVFASADLTSPPFDRTVFAEIPNLRLSSLRHKNPDIEITEEWMSFLNQYQKNKDANPEYPPFFGFLFYDQLHGMDLPADAPVLFPSDWEHVKYERLHKDLDPTPFFNLYKNIAHWLDQWVGKVLHDLEEKEMLKNTIILITADHGQAFNLHKNNDWTHGSGYSEEQAKVPFIWYDADQEPQIYTHWTNHYDVSATLMSQYLGVQNAISDYSVGKNLLDQTPRRWMLVGSPEVFGVIEEEQITIIQFDRSYDIYDRCFNEMPNGKMNISVMQEALEQAKTFYQ